MSEIKFRNAAHRDFFLESMMKCRVNDCYHRAFFYVMGIAGETRRNINAMFDFKTDCIKPIFLFSVTVYAPPASWAWVSPCNIRDTVP
mgnify:CR=1 FL=1